MKSHQFRLMEFLDNFSLPKTFHRCQFFWQGYTEQSDIQRLQMVELGLANLPRAYDWPITKRAFSTKHHGILWSANQPRRWEVVLDNGAMFSIARTSRISFKRGLLVSWRPQPDKLADRRLRLVPQRLILSSVPAEVKLPAVAIKMQASDDHQLDRFIHELIKELKLRQRNPLFIEPEPSKLPDVLERTLTVIYDEPTENLMQQLLLPNWLKVDFIPQTVKLRASWPVD